MTIIRELYPVAADVRPPSIAEDRSRGGSTHLFFWRLRNQSGKTAIPGVPILPVRRIRSGFFIIPDANRAPADS